MSQFQTKDWKQQLEKATKADSKAFIYRLIGPIINWQARHHLGSAILGQVRPSYVFMTRGFPLISRRRWATNGLNINSLSILVQGTGNGWDAVTWAQLRPRRILATDLFDFPQWAEITDYVKQVYKINIEFWQTSMENMSFLPDNSIDIAVSDAVFEHVQNFSKALDETFRVLKPGGRVYASYGPLWYTAGGDHFSGRGGLENTFNHILLDKDAYQSYFKQHLQPQEDFQSGGRYVELGLFSYLRTSEYLNQYASAGFVLQDIILEVSPDAVKFKRQYPNRFRELLERNPQCSTDDFLLKANLVILTKP